jgi:GTP-binding protein
MFIDRAKIFVRGGDGGNGVTAVPPLKSSSHTVGLRVEMADAAARSTSKQSECVNTLLHFRYNPEHKAERGRHGEGSRRHGQDGDDIVVPVPVGTVRVDELTGEVVHDFTHAGERVLVVKGGRGGRGNAQFATPTNRAPRTSRRRPRWPRAPLLLELKLIADVGLVGLPNAGKSTLISRISAARPKIADYPFTTLEPHLGVVDLGDYKPSSSQIFPA